MDRKRISENLIGLRGSKSQSEVASAINIKPSALSMYENGMRIPRDEIKEALAEYYGTTVGAIFFSDECHI